MILSSFFSLLLLSSPQSFAAQGEKFPGGDGTVAGVSVNALGSPASGISRDEKNFFNVGNSFFKGNWVKAPSSTTGRDGLGPTFNAISCSACHFLDGRGEAFTKSGNIHVSLLFRLKEFDSQQFVDHHTYGGQLNPLAIDGVQKEGQATVTFIPREEHYPDGTVVTLRQPEYHFDQLTMGPFGPNTIVSPRVGQQLSGLGLIENISEDDIQAGADEDDRDGDGISGRTRLVENLFAGKPTLGRFGWKAEQPSLHQQNAAAFLGDIGITSPLFPRANCPLVQISCAEAINGGEPEVEDHILGRVTLYVQLIGVPERRHFDDPQVQAGKAVFYKIDCQKCHTEKFTTSNESPYVVLNNQAIYPYSDFLLHDMGDALADFSQGSPALLTTIDREWRTPPLWGLGLVPTVNGHNHLMHDGRARGHEEAILWHGGEAQKSKEKFKSLKLEERQALINFLQSL